MDSRLRWLATALIASVCHTALGEYATWPGCRSTYKLTELRKINHNVTHLHLSYCNLTTTDLDNLKYYPNLEVVFLNGNKINHIEAGTFDFITKLFALYLDQNTFLGKNLPANLFQNWNLTKSVRINFSDNDMTDTPADLLQGLDLFELSLNNCSLREIPSFVKRPVFRDMTALHLDHNLISKLDDPDAFANNVNLRVLFIANNNIDYLHADLLKPLAKIEAIYMQKNKIKVITDGFFHNKTSLSTIKLADNLIEYVSANAFQGTRLGHLSLTGNRLNQLPINFFSELQTFGVTLKVFYFDRNPWQLSCLNGMLDEVQKRNIIYTGGYHSYVHELYEDNLLQCK